MSDARLNAFDFSVAVMMMPTGFHPGVEKGDGHAIFKCGQARCCGHEPFGHIAASLNIAILVSVDIRDIQLAI